MILQARTKALELVEALLPFARAGVAVVGLESSCLLTLRDEALVLGLGEAAEAVSKQALLFEEFVAGEVKAGRFAAKFNPVDAPIPMAWPLPSKSLRRGRPHPRRAATHPGSAAGTDRKLVLWNGRNLRL